MTDTAAKRLSALHITQPWRGVAAFPDGSITNQDRAALSELYIGIGFANSYLLAALPGSFDWTGASADLVATTHINTAAKRYASINVGSPWRGLNLFPTGSFSRDSRYTLAEMYSAFNQGAAYSLIANSGSFAWEGLPAFSDFEVSGISGSFGWTGNSAAFVAGRKIFAAAGAFAMTGNSANLTKFAERTLVAVSGVFGMIGSAANLTYMATFAAEETDSAFALQMRVARQVGAAIEADTAFSLARYQIVAIETDTALSLFPPASFTSTVSTERIGGRTGRVASPRKSGRVGFGRLGSKRQ
jgi:hypothetical protein